MASKYTPLWKRVHWQLVEGDIAYIVNLRGKREYYERTGVKWGP